MLSSHPGRLLSPSPLKTTRWSSSFHTVSLFHGVQVEIALATGPRTAVRQVSVLKVLPNERKHLSICSAHRTARKSKYRRPVFSSLTKQPLFVSVSPDGSDLWRLEPVIDLIKHGGVGIIPTDTLPAVVCDMTNKDAMRRLYLVKHMNPKKPLSLLCRGFSDIGTYTTGFPVSNEPGVPNTFNLAKQILPGPYTLILHASKQLPKQLVDYETNRVKPRRSVGVRWAKDVICQAVLDGVGGPLIASSMHIDHEENEDFELPNGVALMDAYNSSGIDFMVSVGPRMVQESTVIDMTEREPIVLRRGSGEVSRFEKSLS